MKIFAANEWEINKIPAYTIYETLLMGREACEQLFFNARSGSGEKELPRGVEIEPALRAKPTGRQPWDMKQRMTAHAHQLRAVPGKEGVGGLANLCWMGDAV